MASAAAAVAESDERADGHLGMFDRLFPYDSESEELQRALEAAVLPPARGGRLGGGELRGRAGGRAGWLAGIGW